MKPQIFSSNWFRTTFYVTLAATLLTLAPFAPLALAGSILLLTALPGAQLVRWLGLYDPDRSFPTITLSVALGLVVSPVVIYWSSLLVGYDRWRLLLVFFLAILALAAWVSRNDGEPAAPPVRPAPPDHCQDQTRFGGLIAAALIGLTALGVFLAYFELETARGFYPVQMEDWQKHYGVAFALRQTGLPPTSMFFYGMFPEEQLVYYYFLHLTGATFDLLQGGRPFLHQSFVAAIILASIVFSSVFWLLAQMALRSQKAALWSLAFATVIGGLDIIPIIHRAIQTYREHFPTGPLPAGVFLPRDHIDNWVSALSLRLNTFYAHHVWVPQHLTGLTILCLGFYLYLRVEERRKLPVIMPVLLLALVGHTTWIAVIFSGCLFLFALLHIFTTARRAGRAAARRLFLGYALTAAVFGLIAAPFILSLLGEAGPKSGIAFVFPDLTSWFLLRPFETFFGPTLAARMLDLPLHFLIELGALLVAGVGGLILFRRDHSPPESALSPLPRLQNANQSPAASSPAPPSPSPFAGALSGPAEDGRSSPFAGPGRITPPSPPLSTGNQAPGTGDGRPGSWTQGPKIEAQGRQVGDQQQSKDLSRSPAPPLLRSPAPRLPGSPASPLPPLPTPASLLPLWGLLLLAGFLIVSLFASGRGWAELGLIQNNDLGLRALMPGQLVLALFAGYFVRRLGAISSRGWRIGAMTGLVLLIGLGLVSTAWEWTAMGLAKYEAPPQLGSEVYHTLRALPEVTASQDNRFPVVAHRLHRDAARFQLSLGQRPVAFSTGEAVVFHSDVRDLALALELSKQAFDNGLPLWSYQMLRNLGADYIFVGPAEREAERHPEKYRHPQYFQRVFDRGPFTIYRVQPLPYPREGAAVLFDAGTIQFEGYFIDEQPLYPGDRPPAAETAGGLVTAWRLTRPSAKNYTVFIHFVDAAGHIVAQADHQLWAWDVTTEGPTTTWTPQLTHLDITPLPEAALTAAGPVTIRLGLWLPDTGERFPVETSSKAVDEAGRVIIGETP